MQCRWGQRTELGPWWARWPMLRTPLVSISVCSGFAEKAGLTPQLFHLLPTLSGSSHSGSIASSFLNQGPWYYLLSPLLAEHPQTQGCETAIFICSQMLGQQSGQGTPRLAYLSSTTSGVLAEQGWLRGWRLDCLEASLLIVRWLTRTSAGCLHWPRLHCLFTLRGLVEFPCSMAAGFPELAEAHDVCIICLWIHMVLFPLYSLAWHNHKGLPSSQGWGHRPQYFIGQVSTLYYKWSIAWEIVLRPTLESAAFHM